uniref:Immunoglobulin kappa variable 4-1 n=1 Tax=Sphaeramia orbicularis TaxID=375764 RepID=A0A673C7P3_9TELE
MSSKQCEVNSCSRQGETGLYQGRTGRNSLTDLHLHGEERDINSLLDFITQSSTHFSHTDPDPEDHQTKNMTNMSSICICILALTLCITVCRGDIVLTQTPESISVQLGGSATIRCKASSAISNELAWYHQKPGQAPKFIINFYSGMSSGRYQGSGYDYDLSLTISNIQAEDAGVYYCQQHKAFPRTVIQSCTKTYHS